MLKHLLQSNKGSGPGLGTADFPDAGWQLLSIQGYRSSHRMERQSSGPSGYSPTIGFAPEVQAVL